MKKLAPSIALAALALPASGAVHEIPRPTSTTVTSAVVECADDRGCIVEHACATTPLAAPFEDADFDAVTTLALGRTTETPRQGSRNRACVVRARANDGSGAAATANVSGMRYLKASETLNYVGVDEVVLHRARTVAAVSPMPMSGTRTALDYLLERQGTTLAALEGELCAHIDREHDEWTRCWKGELGPLLDLAAYGDTPLARCFVELAEVWQRDSTIVRMAVDAGFFFEPFKDWLDGSYAVYPEDPARYDQKVEECRSLALGVFDAHGISNPWASD